MLPKEAKRETPEELFRRVAKAVASAEIKWKPKKQVEKTEEVFFEIMSSLLFLPNSPTLMNAGTALNQLSACFVLPVEDSLNEIFTSLKNAALIQQSGGGTGFNFSHLRPKGDALTITSGTASGPVSFMKVFNAATEYIKHGGKRRGANMGILNVDHPDIEEFISAKKNDVDLNNFNISVGISNAFMLAVERNDDWILVNPNTKKSSKTIKARKLWNSIVENAWLSGDPGLIFLDTINENNPLMASGRMESTNPCGEVPLFAYEACNLGSIDVARFMKEDKSIDWEKLGSVVQHAIQFLDDIIEINNYIVEEASTVTHANRKIGLGIMGWADLLIQQQIPYDSDAAIALAERLMKFVQQKAVSSSEELARERGCFPNWYKSSFYPDQLRRNATLLSIAPTGTISIIANASSSIEPLFALAYERKHVLDDATLSEINENLLDYLKEYDLYSPGIMDQIKHQGNLSDIASVPEDMKAIFKTALEISPEWHLKHQAAFQKYIDNAVSKTINLHQSATCDDVSHIYKIAWQQRLKGVTIFRYHSKEKQVLEQGISSDSKACKVCAG